MIAPCLFSVVRCGGGLALFYAGLPEILFLPQREDMPGKTQSPAVFGEWRGRVGDWRKQGGAGLLLCQTQCIGRRSGKCGRIFPAFVADVVQVVQPLHILIELVQVQLRIGCGGQVM